MKYIGRITKLTFFLFSLLIFQISEAQIGINTQTPDPASVLDIQSNTVDKGILITRVSIDDLSTIAPIVGGSPESLLVYNVNATTGKGFYYWNTVQTRWIKVGADSDWFESNTSEDPSSIDDSIYTNGQVGIGTDNPNGALHILETIGSSPTNTIGSLILEHDDAGGESSILFKSKYNNASDYAYISYKDDRNGTNTENSLLEIASLNDAATDEDFVDDINFRASGTVGINNRDPEISASLDLGAQDRGLLINRVSLNNLSDQVSILGNVPNGLLVYNTNNKTDGNGDQNVRVGFYYWNNNQWNRISTSNSGLQGYSWDIPNTASPDISTLEKTTVISKTGAYYGNMTSDILTALDPTTDTNGYVIKLVGYYEVKNTGDFVFEQRSDDAARIYIDDVLVLDDWTNNVGGNTTTSASVNLAKGKHKFEFWYYEFDGDQSIRFRWNANPDGLANPTTMHSRQFTID